MASFEICWRSSTRKDLRGLPAEEVRRIVEAVGRLGDEPLPNGSQKLTGSEQSYQIRIGDYRVIYSVSNVTKTVEVQRVRHRKDVYR